MENTSRARILVKYLTPTILSYFSIFLFTIVDGIFVGRGVGSDALGAVNLAFPFILFFNAFVLLTSIGGLTIAAIRVGRGDKEGANEVFLHSFFLTFIVSAILCFAAVFFTTPIARLMGANDSYLQMTTDYLFWYGVFLIPCGISMSIGGFIRNDGRPVLVSVVTIAATLLNIFGDWLFIFPLGMGLKGAAIATGIAQTVGALIGMTHFFSKKSSLHFHRFAISGKLIGKIFVRGLPECIAQFGTPINTVLMNYILVNRLGNAAENAYSLICYVACFAIAMTGGVSEGVQPLFGQSYGARNEKNLHFFRRAGFIIAITGATIITVVFTMLAPTWCVLYGADAETTAVVIASFGKYSWGYVIHGITLIISIYLYSTTRTKYAIAINILRSFVINTSVTLLMPVIFGNDSIWFAFGVFESIVAIISIILMLIADRHGAIGKTLE